MAERLGDQPGGIFSLCELLDEHAEAVEYELLERGYRLAELGSRFSWRDLLVMVKRWQTLNGSALQQSISGFRAWNVEAQLLAEVVDTLAIGNWQRAGKKTAPRPKPLPRPSDERNSFGAGAIPFDEIDDWMKSTLTEE